MDKFRVEMLNNLIQLIIRVDLTQVVLPFINKCDTCLTCM